MSGLSLGLEISLWQFFFTDALYYRSILGPTLGGVLYNFFGFRGPFVMALIGASLDLVFRILIIESKESRKWGYDPTVRLQSVASSPEPVTGAERQSGVEIEGDAELSAQRRRGTGEDRVMSGSQELVDTPLSLLQVIVRLSKSPRALVALLISLVYGYSDALVPLRRLTSR
jgi:hypothetical protein